VVPTGKAILGAQDQTEMLSLLGLLFLHRVVEDNLNLRINGTHVAGGRVPLGVVM
jgi:hypothetical protein